MKNIVIALVVALSVSCVDAIPRCLCCPSPYDIVKIFIIEDNTTLTTTIPNNNWERQKDNALSARADLVFVNKTSGARISMDLFKTDGRSMEEIARIFQERIKNSGNATAEEIQQYGDKNGSFFYYSGKFLNDPEQKRGKTIVRRLEFSGYGVIAHALWSPESGAGASTEEDLEKFVMSSTTTQRSAN